MRAADAIRAAAGRIGTDTARLDAEVLMAHLLGTSRGAVILDPDRQIDAQAFEKLIARRIAGEPVAHITGRREFWSLDLAVTPDVLIPRPDSETLIEVAIAQLPRPPQRILDLGTGSGALLLAALSHWPTATGLGIDSSPASLTVAQANARHTGLATRATFQPGNWGQGLATCFDLILSNPPYIADDEALSDEVRQHEPAMALFAGADGLAAYRVILPQIATLLAPGGLAVVEIGHTQAGHVAALAATAGLSARVFTDLAGRDRCLALNAA